MPLVIGSGGYAGVARSFCASRFSACSCGQVGIGAGAGHNTHDVPEANVDGAAGCDLVGDALRSGEISEVVAELVLRPGDSDCDHDRRRTEETGVDGENLQADASGGGHVVGFHIVQGIYPVI